MVKIDISDYTFTGSENYEVQDIENFDFVDDLMVPEFQKLGYTQEDVEDAVNAVFDNGDYEISKKDYKIKRFYNQTISHRDFEVRGHIEWGFDVLNEEIVLFSDFSQDELYDNQEAHKLFDELLVNLRESGREQFKAQFSRWSENKTLVNDLGNKVTEEDVRIEYNRLSDDDLYEAYDPDVISDEYEFDFDFDSISFIYIEED